MNCKKSISDEETTSYDRAHGNVALFHVMGSGVGRQGHPGFHHVISADATVLVVTAPRGARASLHGVSVLLAAAQ